MTEFFYNLFTSAQLREAGMLALFMAIGGALGLYVRALYRRFGLTVSNRDAFSANFPLLTISTILVIFVVKSSLALSLGLVGALSIVRFRAAIKEPEEIVFLFFCLAMGLALGAEAPGLACAGVLIFTVFVAVRHRASKGKSAGDSLLLTIAGPVAAAFDGDSQRLTQVVREAAGTFTVQRFDVDVGHVQFRAIVEPLTQDEVGQMISQLHAKLPGCSVSYVNLANLL